MRLSELQSQFPRAGSVFWIGIRPERKAPLQTVKSVQALSESGLVGDHYFGRSGNRHVTLIDLADLQAIAEYVGRESIDPGELRRNIVTRGINLLALKEKRFRIGDAILEHTVACHPCSRMEQNLGPGGYNAVRGRGGICARVLESGTISLGDAVEVLPDCV